MLIKKENVEHELKTEKQVFEAILVGLKPWEFRKNDRGFKVGDYVTLRSFDGNKKEYETKGVCGLRYRIEYLLVGPVFGIPEGYCIMTLGNV